MGRFAAAPLALALHLMAAGNANGLWAARPIEVTVRRGDELVVQQRFEQPFARIGGHTAAEVVLTDCAAACQVYLHATNDGIYCLGLSPATPNGWMRAKNYARVGDYRVYAAFADDGPPLVSPAGDLRQATDVSEQGPQIEIRGRHGGKAKRPLPRQLTVVGRSRPSALRLDDETVCDVHCTLFWDGERLWVVDLLSKNGTLLDGRRIQAAPLPAGHDLVIGNNRLRWQRAASDAKVADDTLVAELRARLEESERQRQALAQVLQKQEVTVDRAETTAVERPRVVDERISKAPITAGLLGDELVDRLLDFQAKRQGFFRRRRMILSAAAVVLVLTAVLVAVVIRAR